MMVQVRTRESLASLLVIVGMAMLAGIGYTQREIFDGQSLASPGRLALESRVYPTSHHWKLIADRFTRFAEYHGAESLLVLSVLSSLRSREACARCYQTGCEFWFRVGQ